MGHGVATQYQVVIASGATLSAELDLGRAFSVLYLDPTGAASEVRLQVSRSSGGTYRQVYHPSINSSTVGANVLKIPSSVSGGMIPIPGGFRYMKVETTAAVAADVTIYMVAGEQ